MGFQKLGSYTLVFPMQRAGLFVKQYLTEMYLQSGETTPMVLPSFTTIDMLADSLCTLRADDEVTSVFRLYEAYCKHAAQQMPIDAFYGWGLQLLTDMSNVDMALLDIERMMHYTAEAGKLSTIDIDEEARKRLEQILGTRGKEDSVRRFFTDLWRVLPDIYRDFHEAQLQAGVGTRGERSRWVVEHADTAASIRQELKQRHYVFVGFNYLLAAERRLMEIIRDGDKDTLFYWDYDAHFPLRENGIYGFMQPEKERFGNAMPEEPEYPRPEIEAVAFGSAAGQAQYVHSWLLSHHHLGEKTAIVVADESLLPQVVYSLPNDPKLGRMNITKGYPLRSSHLYGEVLAILRQHAEDSGIPADIIVRICQELEDIYRKQPSAEEDSWLRVLTDESYYQIQASLRQLLQLIRRNTRVAEYLGKPSLLLSLIRRRLEMINIPFHGEPLTDIQIIGVLETRLLDFDNILILSVEEGIVPSTPADRSFLPFDLRKECRISTREEDSKIYGYNFFRLLRRARHVTMTFSEAMTDTGRQSMSRFLMQLLTSPAYTVTRHAVSESDSRRLEQGVDACLEEGEKHPAKLSPSAISDYIECKKEYYLKHIRHIHEAEDESVVFTQQTFGSLVHGTLESLCRQRKEGKEPNYDEALQFAYNKVNATLVRADHEAENYAILKMARNVMESDAKLGKIDTRWLEQEVTYSVQGSQNKVELHGYIDRMDVITSPEGERYIRILDYKTGGYDDAKMKIEEVAKLFEDPNKRYALQTLIYCMLFSKQQKDADLGNLPFRPELFFTRQPAADRLLKTGKNKDAQPLTDYVKQMADSFEKPFLGLVQEILTTTSFPMVEEQKCCDSHCYCPFHLLCNREKQEF